jgi:hypothetical protein
VKAREIGVLDGGDRGRAGRGIRHRDHDVTVVRSWLMRRVAGFCRWPSASSTVKPSGRLGVTTRAAKSAKSAEEQFVLQHRVPAETRTRKRRWRTPIRQQAERRNENARSPAKHASWHPYARIGRRPVLLQC